MNDFVIVPPSPDACRMGHFDEYSYANLFDCYNVSTYNNTVSPVSNQCKLSNGACVGNTDTASSPCTAVFSSASAQSPSLVSRCSSLLSSDSYSDGLSGNITGSNPVNFRTNNYDDKKNVSKTTTNTLASVITRDPRNGAFTFQVHTEYDLLLHVKKDLFLMENRQDGDCIRISEHILHSVDEYCLNKQWMYHIGSEKGTAVSKFLRSRLEKWHKENFNSINKSANGNAANDKVRLDSFLHYSQVFYFIPPLISTLRRISRHIISRHQSLFVSNWEHIAVTRPSSSL